MISAINHARLPRRRALFRQRFKKAALLGCLFVLLGCTGQARVRALDYGEVVSLLSNNVPETVIINMASNQGGIGLSERQADDLRGLGASESLIAALKTRPNPVIVSDSPPAVASSGTISNMSAEGSPIFPADITIMGAHPALCEKEGWLSVTNRDWEPYYLQINIKDKRMFLSKHPNGGVEIDSGENVVLNIRKEGYKLYGDSGEKLEVKIRENLTTTLSLEPFGMFGNSGLRGVATDRGKVRSEILFEPYYPRPQTIIVEPVPAPVIVAPPPPARYYYYGPRYYGPRHPYWW